MNFIWHLAFSLISSTDQIPIEHLAQQMESVIQHISAVQPYAPNNHVLEAQRLFKRICLIKLLDGKTTISGLEFFKIIGKINARVVLGTDTECCILPPIFTNNNPHNLDWANIINMDAAYQGARTNSCGLFTVENAAALNYLLIHDIPITSGAVRDYLNAHHMLDETDQSWLLRQFLLQSIHPNICPGRNIMADTGHVHLMSTCPYLNLNRAGGLNNFHIIGYQGGLDQGILADLQDPFLHSDAYLSQLIAEGAGMHEITTPFFNRLFIDFNSRFVTPNRPGIIHFACVLNNPRHYILISIVKLINMRPIMLIFDSYHCPINVQAPIIRGTNYDFIVFLHNRFIRPFYTSK